MIERTPICRLSVLMLSVLITAVAALAQGTVFTYQGRLDENGNPANGSYDFQFKLFNALSGGAQQGSTQTVTSVTVTNGGFTVQLNFGSNFPGSNRFLEISVKQTSGSTYTTLVPRQQILSTPYAIRSLTGASADALSVACVNCVTSSQIQSVLGSQVTGNVAGSQINGVIPVASVPAGSGNYIQNMIGQQAASNFNITGNGTIGGTLSANVANATTQYNLGGSRVLGAPGNSNLFAGVGAGATNTTGAENAFFGYNAGLANSTGTGNAFFGALTGSNNTTGTSNAFFGDADGAYNTTGYQNAFFGAIAGRDNTAGNNNSFFGLAAGRSNTTGNQNAFFGSNAGVGNMSGNQNAFFGYYAGSSSSTASGNSFFGSFAGLGNTTGSENAFFGYNAGLNNSIGADNAFFGALTGSNNTTGASNAFFGAAAGAYNTTGNQNAFFGEVAGRDNTTGNNNSFFGIGAGLLNTIGNQNAFFGSSAGAGNMSGNQNAFFGRYAGFSNLTGSGNALFGVLAGLSNTTGNNITAIGASADSTDGLNNATAIGSYAYVTANNSLVLGSINGTNGAIADTNVGIGTTAPQARFHIAGNAGNILFGDAGCNAGFNGIGFASSLAGCANYSLLGNGTDTAISRPTGGTLEFREANNTQMRIATGGAVTINNTLTLLTLGAAGTSTSLCRNNTTLQIVPCGASSLRYKSAVAPFLVGLDLVNRLRPISFIWKSDQTRDIGLAAEEVAKVAPFLTFTNAKGEIEGVKYERLDLVLINAIKQQQEQIKQQQEQIKQHEKQFQQQEREIDSLKRLVCLGHPRARICKATTLTQR